MSSEHTPFFVEWLAPHTDGGGSIARHPSPSMEVPEYALSDRNDTKKPRRIEWLYGQLPWLSNVLRKKLDITAGYGKDSPDPFVMRGDFITPDPLIDFFNTGPFRAHQLLEDAFDRLGVHAQNIITGSGDNKTLHRAVTFVDFARLLTHLANEKSLRQTPKGISIKKTIMTPDREWLAQYERDGVFDDETLRHRLYHAYFEQRLYAGERYHRDPEPVEPPPTNIGTADVEMPSEVKTITDLLRGYNKVLSDDPDNLRAALTFFAVRKALLEQRSGLDQWIHAIGNMPQYLNRNWRYVQQPELAQVFHTMWEGADPALISPDQAAEILDEVIRPAFTRKIVSKSYPIDSLVIEWRQWYWSLLHTNRLASPNFVEYSQAIQDRHAGVNTHNINRLLVNMGLQQAYRWLSVTSP